MLGISPWPPTRRTLWLATALSVFTGAVVVLAGVTARTAIAIVFIIAVLICILGEPAVDGDSKRDEEGRE
jgi:hypothetical protein